jgi:stage V sporulation protein B
MGRRLIRLAVPLALNEYLRSGLSTLEHLLIPRGLTRASGSYDEAVAAYGAIHGMVFPVMMFPACVLYSVADLLVPELASCTAAGRSRRIQYLTHRCLTMTLLFACAVGGALFCAAVPLGQLLYRSEAAGRYLVLFAPLVPILYLDAIVDGMHKGLGQQVQCVRYNTITSLLDVALLLVLLPRYGVGGYFFSFTASHVVNFYLSIARLLKVTGYTLPFRFLLCTGLSAVAAGLCTVWLVGKLTIVSVLLAVIADAGLYLALFGALSVLTGAFRRDDLRWLRSALQHTKSAAP